MKTTRIGIVGLGNMGSNHAQCILDGKVPGLELTAVCDRDPERLNKYELPERFEDSAAMIRSGKIDSILIATPHYDHTTIGIDALEQGLHVLVEKPISANKADCEKLLAAHTDKSLVFAAMFNQRLDPHYIKLKSMIEDGELGTIRRVIWNITDWFRTASYYANGDWRATWKGEGGGVLLNQCPHQLDLWQWLFGMPQTLRAFCHIGRYHDIEVEDDVTAYMEYEDGCKGVFITTTGESPGTNRLEVTAENGKVVIEGTSGITFTRNESPMSEWCANDPGGFTKPPSQVIEIPLEGRGPKHLGILQNFVDAIQNGAPLVASAHEGIHSVELANAMQLSSDQEATIGLPVASETIATMIERFIASSTHQKKTQSPKTAGADDFGNSY